MLNKIDSSTTRAARRWVASYPDALLLSAKSADDVARLRERISAFFERDMVEDEITRPLRAAARGERDPRQLPGAVRGATTRAGTRLRRARAPGRGRAPARRRLTECPHRPPCPGCPRWGEPGIDADVADRLAELAHEAGLSPPRVIAGARLGYRHRARLSVRGRANSPKLGIFQEGTHRIVDIPRCHVHHPLVNRVAGAVRRAVRETATPPYAERPHRGALRSVQVVVERASQRAQVVLVGNAEDPAPLEPLARALAPLLPDELHSLWWNGNPERTNVILGPHWQRFSGPEAVCERIGSVEVFFPPGAFGQNHLELADRLVEQVHAWIPDGQRVLELYAGCGPIGLPLLGRSREVAFNEVSPAGLHGLALGLAARPELERARARIVPGEAGAALEALAACDTVIADPPRQGLDAGLLEALIAQPPERLIHASCDATTFLAQARRLGERSPLRLRELLAFDFFPQTRHVETLALFTRQDSSDGSND